MITAEIVWYLEHLVFVSVNVVVGVVSFRGYFDSVERERSLFFLGLSSVLGGAASIASVALWLFSASEQAYEDGSITIRCVALLDTCIWTWAVCALIARFKRLQCGELPAKEP
jgi:hypothetical protein